MINTVQAPRLSDEGRTITSSSVNVLSITRQRPRALSVQLGPVVVVGIIAFVRASGNRRPSPLPRWPGSTPQTAGKADG
jgi:hypothetical protein